MAIYKNKGIIYSECIMDYVSYMMADNGNIIAGAETFYNCREQGYVLRFHNENYDKHLCVWIYAHRNSDEPTITWDSIAFPEEGANMYNQESWEERTKTFENPLEAGVFIWKLVAKHFIEQV